MDEWKRAFILQPSHWIDSSQTVSQTELVSSCFNSDKSCTIQTRTHEHKYTELHRLKDMNKS